MTKIETVGGSDLEKGRVSSAATAPAAAQGAVPPTPGGNVVIVGDPRVSGELRERFIDAVREMFYQHGSVSILYYYGERPLDFLCIHMVAPRRSVEVDDYSHAVIMDEDRYPLAVICFAFQAWRDEVAEALLSFAPEEGVRSVVVEPGERW